MAISIIKNGGLNTCADLLKIITTNLKRNTDHQSSFEIFLEIINFIIKRPSNLQTENSLEVIKLIIIFILNKIETLITFYIKYEKFDN